MQGHEHHDHAPGQDNIDEGWISPLEMTGRNIKHHGMIVIGGEPLQWQMKPGGEVVFERNGDSGPRRFGELGLSDKDELRIANMLCATYRPYAIPDRNNYYAASVCVTDDGRMFVDVNNEHYMKHPFAGRGCAETYNLRKMEKETGKTDVQVASTYLMSGIAAKRADGTLKDKELGHVACLCGECRQNFRSHTKNGKFIMIPSNDGTQEFNINRDAKFPNELSKGEDGKLWDAWEISREMMYPLEEYKELPLEKNDVVKNGYLYVTNVNEPALPVQTLLPQITKEDEEKGTISLSIADYRRLKHVYEFPDMSMPALQDYPTLDNINRVMLLLMKKAYEAHAEKTADGKNLEINVVIVKTDKGEFFPAITVNGDLWLPTKPPELPIALANAYNQTGIEAVYMMTMNDQQVRTEMSAWNGGSTEGHQMKMPDPAALGRLIKNLSKTQNPPLMVIPLNNGQLSTEELNGISPVIDVRQSFGPGFENPKQTIIARH